MVSNRRDFLQIGLAGLWTLNGRAPASARGLDPAVLGANPYFPGYDLYRSIRIMRDIGFQSIEMHPMGSPEAIAGMPPGFQFDRIDESEKRRIKEALSGFRYISTHLPWTDTPYFSPFVPAAEFGVRQIDIALEATAFLGAEVANIHVQRSAHISMEQAWPTMIRQFRQWGDTAGRHGFRLAIETGYPRSVRDFVRLIQEIDHEHVGATVDVGHQGSYAELLERVPPDKKGTPEGIRAYNDVTLEIIDRLGSKIFHMHIHDIEPDTWSEHKPLVHGFVDYPRLIAKLREIKYDGLLIFEIGGPVESLGEYFADAKQKVEAYLAAG